MIVRQLGRVIGLSDDLVYCIFPGWGRYMAVGVPMDVFHSGAPKVGQHFFVKMRLDHPQLFHEDFEFSDWEIDIDQDIPSWENLSRGDEIVNHILANVEMPEKLDSTLAGPDVLLLSDEVNTFDEVRHFKYARQNVTEQGIKFFALFGLCEHELEKAKDWAIEKCKGTVYEVYVRDKVLFTDKFSWTFRSCSVGLSCKIKDETDGEVFDPIDYSMW